SRGPPLAPGGGRLGAPACAPRRGPSGLLAVAAARLSALVASASRASPALASLHAPSGRDARLPGRSDRARHPGPGWERMAPAGARGPAPPAAGPPRPRASPLEGRGDPGAGADSGGGERRLGGCHGPGRRSLLAVAHAAVGGADAWPQ